ncbi:MAG: penicillin-binding protein 2 [Candidatus Omnitrophica bacterium CG23_combo_of_CG06-09_8_20_14_all_40_11]|nr:MAG: penicillin-binding protein 2 [Candidatus Omnitrophica bacterium CG23_combo_of_CG06-09_8_20_14_all_40_11]
MRVRIVNWLVIATFLFIALNILNMEVIQGKKFKNLSNQNCIRLIPQEGSRGRILDRQGNIIVDNNLSYNVMVSSYANIGIDKTLLAAARILNVDFKVLQTTFRNKYIAPFMPTTIAKNIDVKKAIALEELKPDLDNIIIQPYPLRSYPYGRLACHIIGYLNEIDRWRLTKLANYGYKTKDIVGFGGVEEKYDYLLRQEAGGLSVEVDHRGRLVSVLGFKPPSNGKDIQLTIDLKIQKIAEENLKGRNGSVIIMEPYSGEIIALASSSNFNPSVFLKQSDSAVVSLLDNSDAPFINRAISGVYPAGSVFKLVVATAALETGKISLSTAFYCPGSIYIGKQKFSCWDTHNQQNLIGAITHSCNVFFYRTGLLVGAQNIYDYALKFGFSHPTAIDLPYEASGFVPSPLWKKIYRLRNWFEGDTANLAIGQGELLVTPLQITRMMAIFANRGTLVTPYIVKAINGQGVANFKRRAVTLSLKESTINYIRQGLRSVVSDAHGTADLLSDLPVSVAGKTGTAQVAHGQPHGWFVGFFPYQAPKFVICVFLEHGGSGYTSSIVAKQIIESMVKEGVI